MSDSHWHVLHDLETTGQGLRVCRGNSMLPVLTNPATCFYRKEVKYKVGDIVLCKVRGRMIDAHRITKIAPDGRYMIANNHGHENGWTRLIYGRVVKASDDNGVFIYEA